MSANPDKLKAVKTLARPDIVFAIARKPGTSQVFCGGSDFSVYQLDLEEPKPEPKELGRHESYVTGLACSGATLVSGGYDGRLIWWNAESHSKIREVPAHAKWIRNVAATPDGSIIASVADDMVCRLWDCSSGRLIRELRGHAELTPSHLTSMLYALAISRDGTLLATGDKVGHIVVWDIQSGRSLARAPRHRSSTPGILTSSRHWSAGSVPWHSRPTASSWRPAAAAGSRTSIIWMAKPWWKSLTGKKASAPTPSPATSSRAWSSAWNFTQAAPGCSPAVAATRTASSCSLTSPQRSRSPRKKPRWPCILSRSMNRATRSMPPATRRSWSLA